MINNNDTNIIDTEFIMNKYGKIIIDKNIDFFDKSFDHKFYQKTYNYKFNNYNDAYLDWAKKRNYGYLGKQLIEDDVKYYSQIRQDYIIINELFKKCTGGVFVEFGGCDGIFLSNTYTLEKYFGWNGLLIEANKTFYNELLKNRTCLKENKLLWSSNNEKINFSNKTDMELSQITLFSKDVKNDEIECLETYTLEKILDDNKITKEIHYMSVDVEGAEYDILKVFPFNKKYKVYSLSIEHAFDIKNRNKIKELMLENGYILYKELLWDDIYVLPELLNKKVVNSFDVFDTLVHRFYITETSIFEKIEKEYGYDNFLKIRKECESKSNGTLDDIYEKMKEYYTSINMEIDLTNLKKLEIDLENKYLIKNEINCKMIKNNDILISDTYYNEKTMNTFLNNNLINNTLFASPNGKRNGNIWDILKNEYIIVSHYGDNKYTDFMSPKSKGINAILINNDLDIIEKILLEYKCTNLCYAIRNSRVKDNDELYRNSSVIFIINLLIYIIVNDFMKTNEYDNILLTMRDCCHLYNIFKTFEKDVTYKYLYSSRICYEKKSNSFTKYFSSLITGNKNLILDMNGTGKTVKKYLDNKYTNVDVLYICKFGNENIKCIYDNVREIIDSLEYMNYDIAGSTIDFETIPIKDNITYDLSLIYPTHKYIANVLDIITQYNIEQKILLELKKININELKILLIKFIMLYKNTTHFSNIVKFH
jgi:hypothetical protein